MASIRPSGSKWRVQVYVKGVRASETFPTRKEAAQWALEREAEMRGSKLPEKTLMDAMRRYVRDMGESRSGWRWEAIRLKAMERHPLAKRRLEAMDGSDFADWRDARLKKVKPGTVAREMNLLRSVLEVARRDWKWIRVNPMAEVRWPKCPKGRARAALASSSRSTSFRGWRMRRGKRGNSCSVILVRLRIQAVTLLPFRTPQAFL